MKYRDEFAKHIDYAKDNANLGKNNPDFNISLNENTSHNGSILKLKLIQTRINEIAHQFNTKFIEPKDMKLTINGQTYTTNPKTSTGVPVYQGVSDQNVFSYFKELSGVDKLPNPKLISNMKDLNGNTGKVWSVKPTVGPLKGSTINLRTFSTSQNITKSKFTIEIVKPNKDLSGIKNNIEIKFER